jgi:F-type H+-transporting ATPase subunit epsilon
MPDKFQLTIVTPESVALNRSVDFAALPAYDGEIGILPDHAAMVCRLGPGEVRIQDGAAWTSWFIDGGVVQVRDNSAVVLANAATAPEKIDVDKTRRELTEAVERRTVGADARAKREADILRARRRLHVAERRKA